MSEYLKKWGFLTDIREMKGKTIKKIEEYETDAWKYMVYVEFTDGSRISWDGNQSNIYIIPSIDDMRKSKIFKPSEVAEVVKHVMEEELEEEKEEKEQEYEEYMVLKKRFEKKEE